MFKKRIAETPKFSFERGAQGKISSRELFNYLGEKKLINNGKIDLAKLLYDADVFFDLLHNYAITPQAKASTILLYSMLVEGKDNINEFEECFNKTSQVVAKLTRDVLPSEKGLAVLKKVAVNLRGSNNDSIYSSDNKTLGRVVEAILNGDKFIGDCLGFSSLYSFILLSRGEDVGFIRLKNIAATREEYYEERHMMLRVGDKVVETTRKDLQPIDEESINYLESESLQVLLSEFVQAAWINTDSPGDKYKLMQIIRDNWERGENVNNRIRHLYNVVFNAVNLVTHDIGLFDKSKEVFSADEELKIRYKFSIAELFSILDEKFFDKNNILLDNDALNQLVRIIDDLYKSIDLISSWFKDYPIREELTEKYEKFFLKLFKELEKRYIGFYNFSMRSNNQEEAIKYGLGLWARVSDNTELVDHKKFSSFLNSFLIRVLDNKQIAQEISDILKEIINKNKIHRWITNKKLLEQLELIIR